MIVKIYTNDKAWAAKHAHRTAVENGNNVAFIEIADNSVERLTFGPKKAQMIRFDLRQIAKRIPSDHFNANAMIPAMHIASV